jgi:hypothetical protein
VGEEGHPFGFLDPEGCPLESQAKGNIELRPIGVNKSLIGLEK